ncbi:neurochondrin homolog [Coccinella septempunctata]|uniref:neurochondrin homolog n=1 Tax=Coccinella septempunctata TaxID=41139 RepID=UPI001D07E514|nr:neurochondrin homolog [Coccinella septempunctata]
MSGQVSEQVKKCCIMIKHSLNDTQKFAALFMVTKLVHGPDCTLAAKTAIFNALGFDFLKKLLLTTDVPLDCPPSIYKSIALSILTVFCEEPELACKPEVLDTVPIFLDIVKQSDNSDYDDNLMAVGEAYHCLKRIAITPAGQDYLIEADGITILSEIYIQGSFQSDEALKVLGILVCRKGSKTWSGNVKGFHNLMNKLALDFETDQDKRKFDLCETLNTLVFNSPRTEMGDSHLGETWPQSIHKGLSDILQSKIVAQQRNPALLLAASGIDLLGIEWIIQEDEKCKQFFLLLIQLAAVEIRMQLDGKSLKAADAETRLITSCYSILEYAMAYITTDQMDLDQKEKQTLYTGLKGAFTTVIKFLLKVSNDRNSPAGDEKLFICATIRVLASWLAQETTAMRAQVYQLLPFMLEIANETFKCYRANKIAEKAGNLEGAEDDLGHVDVLRILMPALCHLAVEDTSRKILLKNDEHRLLYEFIEFHWSIVHYKRPPVPRSERLKVLAQPQVELSPEILEEMNDSRLAMISACNVFMNLTVLEPKFVDESPVFNNLMKFIFENLPELKDIPENLVLHGNLAVLGLLLLKQMTNKVKKNDFSICRYIQATIRFLWDAYTIDESNDPTSLVVAMSYKKHWMELAELWFLGMQTMSSVISLIPWISEFAIESGWAEGIINLLKEVRIGSLPSNVKLAFEDFLCHLVDANESVVGVLKKADALKVCKNHRLMEFGKKMFGD